MDDAGLEAEAIFRCLAIEDGLLELGVSRRGVEEVVYQIWDDSTPPFGRSGSSKLTVASVSYGLLTPI